MAKSPKASNATKAATAPKDAGGFRKATKAELRKMGASEKSERYIPKTVKRVTAKTASISKRAFSKLQTGLTLEQRATAIATGKRASGNVAASKAAAARLVDKWTDYMRRLTGLSDSASKGELDDARRAAGLSEKQFSRARREFAETNASAWVKPEGKRRYEYMGPPSHQHVFINSSGEVQHASFSGGDLIAMRKYREAFESGNQARMDKWASEYAGRVQDVSGELIDPSTDLRQINAAIGRMTPKQAKRFFADLRYASRGEKAKAA